MTVLTTSVEEELRKKIATASEKETTSYSFSLDSTVYLCHRIELALPSLCFLKWLEKQQLFPKIYWSDRSRLGEVAAVGEILNLPKLPKKILGDLPRFFYGRHFKQRMAAQKSSWEDFPKESFILPACELIRRGEETSIAFNVLPTHSHNSPQEAAGFFLSSLQMEISDGSLELEPPKLLGKRFSPKKEVWKKGIENALEAIRTKEIEKVVLARQASFEYEENLSALSLLQKLKEKVSRGFLFGIQFTLDQGFIGASPERLYYRHQRRIETEALAGTRKRGLTPGEDELLAMELLQSEKDASEVEAVKEHLKEQLLPLCSHLQWAEENTIIKTPTVQHLYCPFEGELKGDVEDSHLLEVLHPTPAVGGRPKQKALSYLLNIEGFDRGWYAAPVGWVSSEEAEFSVAIRSGLVCKNQLHLFTGTGIVSASDPDEEWDELNHKMSGFTKLFT